MRTTLFFLFLFFYISNSNAQTLCGTADEGGTVNLTAPSGAVFISVTYASYGTPNGSCGSFTNGGCHAANSVSIVQSYLIGNNSASIPATNGVFGDPCGGTFKRLYIEAIYSFVTPLKLVSFSGSIRSNGNLLQWETAEELNTLKFDIERSTDGALFTTAGTIAANNRSGNNSYSYTDNAGTGGTTFYRLKMADIEGKFVYSNIIKLSGQTNSGIQVFPNPVTDNMTLAGLRGNGLIELLTINGQVLLRRNVTMQTETLSLAGIPGGIYILRYRSDAGIGNLKIIKR